MIAFKTKTSYRWQRFW